MSKTLYMRFQPVRLLENFPGSLQDTIVYNGLDTGVFRYYEVFGNSFAGDRDYLEFTISTMTFTTPPDLNQLGTVSREGGVETYTNWITRSVPDNFVIPTGPIPDLKVIFNSLAPATLGTDGTLNFNFNLINDGNAAANFTHLGFYLSADKVITTSDTLLLDFDDGALAANTQVGISFGMPLANMYQPVGPGKYYVGIIVDYDNKVPNESREDNNVSNAIAITVTGTAANNPPTGGVTITGTPLKGGTLTANTAALQDLDGLGTLHYQWQHSADGAAWTNVGIDAGTYSPNAGDVGDFIRVIVSYVDKKSHAESVTSGQTAKVTEVSFFTPNSDEVNFNALTVEQKAAVLPLTDLYHAKAGDDIVKLPDVVNFMNAAKGGVTWQPATWFEGEAGNDKITGGLLADHIDGGADNDILIGGGGNDTLKGGPGNDIIIGGSLAPGETVDEHRPGKVKPVENDVAVFSGNYSDYEFRELQGGYLQVRDLRGGPNSDGTDILRDVRNLKFNDTQFNADLPAGDLTIPIALPASSDANYLVMLGRGNPRTSWAPDGIGPEARAPTADELDNSTTTITYSFATAASVFASDYFATWAESAADIARWPNPHFVNAAPVSMRNAVRSVFDYLESVTNLHFVPIEESSGQVGAIRFLGTAPLGGTTLGLTKGPGNSVGGPGGDIIISDSISINASPEGKDFLNGDLGWSVVAHEIGHALGLDHYEGKSKSPEATIMVPNATLAGANLYRGFQPLDIKALQYLYGHNDDNAGHTTWTSVFSSGRLPFFDDAHFSSTLYAPGPDNILDWSALRSHIVYMDLKEGGYVYLGDPTNQTITSTLGIAYGTQIKTAIGGDLGDTLLGNAYGNDLRGGGGDDTVSGGVGADILTGGADVDTFKFLKPTDGADTVTDFVTTQDHIEVARAGFRMKPNVDIGTGDAYDFGQHYFVSGNAPVATEGKHGQFLFDNGTHQLFWDADGIGTKSTSVLIASFANGAIVHASDFVLT